MNITATLVRDLRERTSAGMMDCKKALEESKGDFDKAVEWLRTKGIAKADKKSGRVAAEGLVHSYIHAGGRVGVLLEVNSETDFLARTDGFTKFVADVAMHIAAMSPRFVKSDEIPQDVRDTEKRILLAKAAEEGKKPEMLEKIVEGQLKKWSADICLLDQKYVKNPDLTIEQYLKETIASLGENVVIRRFIRYELGEGIEKPQDNFAEEVARQVKG
ncbi:MAG: translation elongation factor Ts [Bdellovibrionales bacterium]|nr:translation elongation factor Ts [Bdellovibrionales bacterium]